MAEPGTKIGSYELVEPLGEGSQAEVWLARSRGEGGFEKQVALKLFHPGEASELLQFTDEARTGAALRSPYLVAALDFGRSGEQRYIAMEHVVGPTLREVRRRLGRLRVTIPQAVALDIGIQVARGLAFAHELRGPDGAPLGLVHRDIKPSNIILDHEGVAKLMDFGISLSRANLAVTSGSVIKGTPYYMAPEQWRSRELLAPASDLFSVGCVLWELVTGKVLFKAEDFPAILDLHRERSPAKEAAYAEERLPGLGDPLEHLLARDPAARLATARELEARLTKLRGNYPPDEGLRTFGRLWEAWDRGAVTRTEGGDPRARVVPAGADWQPWLSALARQGHPLVPSGLASAKKRGGTDATLLVDEDAISTGLAPLHASTETGPTGTQDVPLPPLGPGSRPTLGEPPTIRGLAIVLLLIAVAGLWGRPGDQAPLDPPTPEVLEGQPPPLPAVGEAEAESRPVQNEPEATETSAPLQGTMPGGSAAPVPTVPTRGLGETTQSSPRQETGPGERSPAKTPATPRWSVDRIQVSPAAEVLYGARPLNQGRANEIRPAEPLRLDRGPHTFTVRSWTSGHPTDKQLEVNIPEDLRGGTLRLDAR